MTGGPGDGLLEGLGFHVIQEWDHDRSRTDVVDGWARIRREQPAMAGALRPIAWDLRKALRADLPDVPPATVERVALCLMSKLGALELRLGADPGVVATSGNVVSIAVVDDVWPGDVR